MPDVVKQNLSIYDGLKNIYYALETKDDSTGTSYNTPKKLGHARRAEMTKETEVTNVYGDNAAVATRTRLKTITLTIETTDIPLEDQAVLLGHTVDSVTGAITAKADVYVFYFVILFEGSFLNVC